MAVAGYSAKTERNWVIPQGADTINAFRYGTRATDTDPVDYPQFVTDGWTARAQIRPAAGKAPWVTLLSSADDGPRVELTDEGEILLIIPSSTTESTDWDSRHSGAYDVELIRPDGFVIRLAAGQVNVSHDITRV